MTTLQPRGRSRIAPLALAAGLAVLLHGVLLGVVPVGTGFSADETVRPVMQARQIVQVSPPPAPPGEVLDAEPAPAPPPAVRPARARATPAPGGLPAGGAEVAPSVVGDVAVPVEALAAAEAAASAPAAAEPGGWQVPTFATKLPPPAVLRFVMRRGGLSGDGELVWQPRADGYTMSMHASAFGMPLITWASDGLFDASGVAPLRFVDQRRARNARAANFRRDTGTISFSGSQVEYPLVPGAQDRLSWMVQLPAIIAAAPGAFPVDARIPVFVVGARGDGDVWTFVVQGSEPVETEGNRVPMALHLLREPRRPFDTRAEVWLDPERHFLPVRLKLTPAPSGEGNEFVLREMTLGPGP